MAATTRPLASSDGCIALLNYDDVTLLATGVTVANVSGIEMLIFSITINSQTSSATVDKGQTAFIPFSVPASLVSVLGVADISTLGIVGLNSYGIGTP